MTFFSAFWQLSKKKVSKLSLTTINQTFSKNTSANATHRYFIIYYFIGISYIHCYTNNHKLINYLFIYKATKLSPGQKLDNLSKQIDTHTLSLFPSLPLYLSIFILIFIALCLPSFIYSLFLPSSIPPSHTYLLKPPHTRTHNAPTQTHRLLNLQNLSKHNQTLQKTNKKTKHAMPSPTASKKTTTTMSTSSKSTHHYYHPRHRSTHTHTHTRGAVDSNADISVDDSTDMDVDVDTDTDLDIDMESREMFESNERRLKLLEEEIARLSQTLTQLDKTSAARRYNGVAHQ